MDKILECDVVRIEEQEMSPCGELLVCEYPLTIILNKKKLATLLCSPEKLKELTYGFLITEQIIKKAEDIVYFNLDEEKGIVEVETANKDINAERFHSKKVNLKNLINVEMGCYENFFDSINCEPVNSDMVLPYENIYEFMVRNLNYSEVFKKTGGVHCVAMCDTNEILVISEDVARHNALDKVIGESVLKNIFLKDKIIILSGRVSLEMILKAAKMQIPIIISKSAPTSMSVALAKRLNITLVGFVRGRKMNIYSNGQRIKFNDFIGKVEAR